MWPRLKVGLPTLNNLIKKKCLTSVLSHLGLINSICRQVTTKNNHHTNNGLSVMDPKHIRSKLNLVNLKG